LKIACPVCGYGDCLFWARRYDRLFGLVPGTFTLNRCPSCRCISQSPLPAESDIAGFYPETYWWSDSSARESVIQRLERAYREFVAADHVRFLERCAKGAGPGERVLLDIGCGGGLFLHLASRRGFVPYGMDLFPQAVRVARGQYGLDVRQGMVGSDIWGGLRFDFLTMFHVLEHVTEPRAALEYARGLLKPGGSLIVQVPNVDSLQARCFGPRWYGLDVPRHVINFTPVALQRLLSESGFAIVDRAKFSLRDNPASIASSLLPRLDPIGRAGSTVKSGSLAKMAMDCAYFGLVLLSLPVALLESALGLGGTIWLHARVKA
jgi:SAM-dependent methyltransferase